MDEAKFLERIKKLEHLCLHMYLHGTWRLAMTDEEALETWKEQYEKPVHELVYDLRLSGGEQQ